ncbi:MAG: fluoride efflux transporter CrcB [Actinomycetota bacterium]
MRLIWIGLASFFGGISRYLVEGWISSATRGTFPWGTLAVNASGSFLLGFIFTVMTERFLPHPDFRVAVTAGFLGAYTTFSTFAFETFRLGEDGAIVLASLNVVASVLAGVIAVWLGIVAGRAL